jgi:hypothetical protein
MTTEKLISLDKFCASHTIEISESNPEHKALPSQPQIRHKLSLILLRDSQSGLAGAQ